MSKGRRQVTWSLGDHDLRTLAGLDPEQSDEEIAAEEVLHGDDALALPHETWTALRRAGETTDLLDVTETGGYEGAVCWLGERGLDWLYASTAA